MVVGTAVAQGDVQWRAQDSAQNSAQNSAACALRALDALPPTCALAPELEREICAHLQTASLARDPQPGWARREWQPIAWSQDGRLLALTAVRGAMNTAASCGCGEEMAVTSLLLDVDRRAPVAFPGAFVRRFELTVLEATRTERRCASGG